MPEAKKSTLQKRSIPLNFTDKHSKKAVSQSNKNIKLRIRNANLTEQGIDQGSVKIQNKNSVNRNSLVLIPAKILNPSFFGKKPSPNPNPRFFDKIRKIQGNPWESNQKISSPEVWK